MEVGFRTVAITLPQADTGFLRKLSGKMGWQIANATTCQKHAIEAKTEAKQHTLKAIADVRQGKGVTSCASFDEYLKAVAQ